MAADRIAAVPTVAGAADMISANTDGDQHAVKHDETKRRRRDPAGRVQAATATATVPDTAT